MSHDSGSVEISTRLSMRCLINFDVVLFPLLNLALRNEVIFPSYNSSPHKNCVVYRIGEIVSLFNTVSYDIVFLRFAFIILQA